MGLSNPTFTVSVAALVTLTGCIMPPMEDMSDYEPLAPYISPNSVYYDGTSGKVGHHMTARPLNSGGCVWDYSTAEVVRALPPGISLSGSRLEGTPSQPGVWRVTVYLYGLHCTQGPDQTDQGTGTVRVSFNIEP